MGMGLRKYTRFTFVSSGSVCSLCRYDLQAMEKMTVGRERIGASAIVTLIVVWPFKLARWLCCACSLDTPSVTDSLWEQFVAERIGVAVGP